MPPNLSMELKMEKSAFKDMVSVIVPLYNSEKYLRRCIDSIVNQTHKNIELILINDGSTDTSGELCDSYARRDNRIKVIHNKNNGPAQARNTGIENSEGDFIIFVDSDDFIENNALSVLIDNYSRNNADIIIGDARSIKDGVLGPGYKGSFMESRLLTKQEIADYARHYLKKPNKFTLFAYSWGRLFKSSIVKDNRVFFNVDLHTFEDVAFNFDYLNYAEKIFFLKEPVYNHLIHNNYMSATMAVSDNPRVLFGYKRALYDIGKFLRRSNSGANVDKETGHAFVCLTIIQLVRICGQINKANKDSIIGFIREIINDPELRENLGYYSPSNGDSRILPVLMKLKLIGLIVLVCRYKANRRYKKAGVIK